MNEMKGAIFGILVFMSMMLPGLIGLGIDSLHQHAFMKTTTELSEIVKEEGGVGAKTKKAVERLEDNGYSIKFTDQHDTPLYGKVNYGDTVKIEYDYEYRGARSVGNMHTKNEVFVMKRNEFR